MWLIVPSSSDVNIAFFVVNKGLLFLEHEKRPIAFLLHSVESYASLEN